MATFPADTPVWAQGFFTQLTEIRGEIGAISKNISNINRNIDELKDCLHTIEAGVKYLDAKTTAMQIAHANKNTCEVRISGIPRELLENIQALETAVI